MGTLKNVVGLFGTCGDSKWRDQVMESLRRNGISYFNPVVPDWTPECADVEADHLATDRVILFVVTGETEGYGSLAETGWAALSASVNGQRLMLVVEDHPSHAKSDSNRARKLVRAHAGKSGVKLFSTVGEALAAVEAIMAPYAKASI